LWHGPVLPFMKCKPDGKPQKVLLSIYGSETGMYLTESLVRFIWKWRSVPPKRVGNLAEFAASPLRGSRGGLCEGDPSVVPWSNGQEAGNGGNSQGRPTAHRDLLDSERPHVTPVRAHMTRLGLQRSYRPLCGQGKEPRSARRSWCDSSPSEQQEHPCCRNFISLWAATAPEPRRSDPE
jgi:hypothetical protein